MKRIVAKTTEEAAVALSSIDWKNPVAIDTETTDLRYARQRVHGFSVCDGNTVVYIDCLSNDFLVVIKYFLSQSSTIIGHNLVFDVNALATHGIDLTLTTWFDTMVAAHLINENGSKSLKQLARDYLDVSTEKWEEVSSDIHSQRFYDYAMNDAEWTYQLAYILKNRLEEQETDKLFRLVEMPFLKVLARMQRVGIRVDIDSVRKTTKELIAKITDSETRLLDLLDKKYQMQITFTGETLLVSDINFSSTKQLLRIFEQLGLSITETTKKGNPSVGRFTIEQLKDKHPFVKELHKYRGLKKLLNAFFEPLPTFIDPDNRLRPGFRDTGTVTGRLSSNNPNFQQLPKNNKELGINTRSCFIASPGKKMVAVDYSQQETRILVELTQDSGLSKILLNNGDFHLINANLLFGLGLSEEELFEAHPNYKKHRKQYSSYRDKAKAFTFGVSYGMGPHRLSKSFGVTIEEAQEMLDRFWQGFPDFKKRMDSVHQEAEECLVLTTFAGRKRHFERNQWGKLDEKALRQGFNFLIQGYGADLIREACIKVGQYSVEHPELGIELLATVHDEILLECVDSRAEEVAETVKQLMISCGTMSIPLAAEYSIGNNYGECK